MTVGIAVLCDGGKTIVVASDRMVVHDFGSTSIQTETDCIKFETLDAKTLMLYTGYFHDQQAIVARTGEIKNCSTFDLVTRLRSACESHHDDMVERTLRRVGTNLKELGKEAIAQAQASNLVSVALKNLTGQFVIAGADLAKGYIYSISDNSLTLHDHPGFVAVGSGSLLAHSSLAVRGAHKKLPIEEAACLAYEAKKLAEATYGVGKKTDIGIVGVGIEARLLSEDAVEGMDRVYMARRALKKSDKDEIRRLMVT